MTRFSRSHRSLARATCALGCLAVLSMAFVPVGEDPPPFATPRLRAPFSTDHYTIRTNLDPEFADDIAKRMDAMYEEYTRRFIDFLPPGSLPRLEVYLF